MKISTATFKPYVARQLVAHVADPSTHMLADRAGLAGLGLTVPAEPPEASFAEGVQSLALDVADLPTPVMLDALNGFAGLATSATPGNPSLAYSARLMERAICEQIGESPYALFTLVLTAPKTLSTLLDDEAPGAERALVAGHVAHGVATALEAVWPHIGPWRKYLGVALQVADAGQLVYLGASSKKAPGKRNVSR